MKYALIFLSIFSLLNFKEINQDIIISFTELYDQYISDENGVFSLSSNHKDSDDLFDSNDFEENTKFDMELPGSTKRYPMKCRLFKGGEKAIILICNLNGALEKSEIITIKETKNVPYKDYNLILNFDVNNCQINKASYKVPFLYSADQKFDIQENQKTINLEFKYESYNEEPLVIHNSGNPGLAPLKNCQKSGKILKCEALIEDINKILKAKSTFYLRYYHDVIGSKGFKFTADININYNIANKENIYLKIERPVYNETTDKGFYTFPTNITNLPKIKTYTFETKISDVKSSCFLIKHEETTPLYLICYISKEGSFNIGDYAGFNQNNIYYKYNFILEPGKMDETVSHNNEKNFRISSVYPDTLDFKKVDSLKVYLHNGNKFEVSIRLNEAGNDLECEDKKELKVCKVPKNHFNGAKTGYYFIRHKTEAYGYMPHYETFGVNYVLSKSQAKILSSSVFLFALLSLILF